MIKKSLINNYMKSSKIIGLLFLIILIVISIIKKVNAQNDISLVKIYLSDGTEIEAKNCYYEAAMPVIFSFNKEYLSQSQIYLMRYCDAESENYTTYEEIKDGKITVDKINGESIKYKFYMYDRNTEEIEPVGNENDFYGIKFIDANAERSDETSDKFEADIYAVENNVIYINSGIPKLYMYCKENILSNYVISREGNGSEKFDLREDTILTFEEGKYKVELFDIIEGKNQIRDGFPIDFVYDKTSPSNVKYNLEVPQNTTEKIIADDNRLIAGNTIYLTFSSEDNITKKADIYVNTSGEFIKTDTIKIENGALDSFFVKACDECGNMSQEYFCNIAFLVDNTEPKLDIETEQSDNAVNIIITAKDDIAGIGGINILYKDRELFSEEYEENINEKTYELTIDEKDIEYFENILRVEVYDRVKNYNSRECVIEKNDLISPEIKIFGVENGKISPSNVCLSVNVYDDNIDCNSVSMQAVKNGKEKKIYKAGEELFFDEEGDYLFSVTAADKAGNVSESRVAFTIDKNAPEIIGIKDLPSVFTESFSIKRLMSKMFRDKTLVQYRLYLNGMDYNENDEIKEPGKYNIRIVATDQAGNMSQEQTDFYIKQNSIELAVSNNQVSANMVSMLNGQKLNDKKSNDKKLNDKEDCNRNKGSKKNADINGQYGKYLILIMGLFFIISLAVYKIYIKATLSD